MWPVFSRHYSHGPQRLLPDGKRGIGFNQCFSNYRGSLFDSGFRIAVVTPNIQQTRMSAYDTPAVGVSIHKRNLRDSSIT